MAGPVRGPKSWSAAGAEVKLQERRLPPTGESEVFNAAASGRSEEQVERGCNEVTVRAKMRL